MRKRVPEILLEQIKKAVPSGAEVVPLDFRYDDEDYNIAVFINEGTDPKAVQDHLYDIIFDYDDTHGTATHCSVWSKSQRRYVSPAPADPPKT